MIQQKEALFIGGNFWDGRATGKKPANPAADQAQGPFLNPLEQALDAPADVVARVCASSYSDRSKEVWGEEACEPGNADMAYGDIALSIADYEACAEVNAFTSKFDLSKSLNLAVDALAVQVAPSHFFKTSFFKPGALPGFSI